MAVYEVRVDDTTINSGDVEAMTGVYETAIESDFETRVELCKVIILESVEHGLVVKKRRGRKAKKHVM